mmetsp:Transcript_9924/g.22146  ORF Transcript_9924/g.22146 Transcript_9924/m.22146 type:complete len:84 (-) Transcript_9924:185-436(-)
MGKPPLIVLCFLLCSFCLPRSVDRDFYEDEVFAKVVCNMFEQILMQAKLKFRIMQIPHLSTSVALLLLLTRLIQVQDKEKLNV